MINLIFSLLVAEVNTKKETCIHVSCKKMNDNERVVFPECVRAQSLRRPCLASFVPLHVMNAAWKKKKRTKLQHIFSTYQQPNSQSSLGHLCSPAHTLYCTVLYQYVLNVIF